MVPNEWLKYMNDHFLINHVLQSFNSATMSDGKVIFPFDLASNKSLIDIPFKFKEARNVQLNGCYVKDLSFLPQKCKTMGLRYLKNAKGKELSAYDYRYLILLAPGSLDIVTRDPRVGGKIIDIVARYYTAPSEKIPGMIQELREIDRNNQDLIS